MNAPCFVQGREDISTNDLIANEAQISKKLMVMSFAVRQPALFIMTMSQEGFLAFGTNEVLDMEMLSKGGNDSLFNGSSTSSTNRNPHSIVTAQAVKLIHVVRSKSGATFDLASCRVQLDAAAGAIEMISMVDFATETQWRTIDKSMALLARVLADLRSFDVRITSMAQSAVVVADEARVS